MRDEFAVLFFVGIILFILAMYIISALYFDGLVNFIDFIIDSINIAIDGVRTLFRAIYETFIG